MCIVMLIIKLILPCFIVVAPNVMLPVFFPSLGGSAYRIVIFCTIDNLHRLAEAEMWFVDGTFHAAPAIFCQLFTTHVMIHNQVHLLSRHQS